MGFAGGILPAQGGAMRQTRILLSVVAVMAVTGCGPTGNTPWDENRDGLIGPCEGLNPTACDATAGCEPAAVVCDLACRDDGHGGCLPCPGGETCRPTPPPPAFDCAQLTDVQCINDSRCELVEGAVRTEPTGGAEFAPPAPDQRPPSTRFCVNRLPTPCESLPADLCLARPGCALETSGATCDVACFAEGCPPCATPAQRCVTMPSPGDCSTRDANTCTIDGRCALEFGAVCDIACEPGGNCPPCATPTPVCVPLPPPDFCGARDANTCTLDGRCVLESGPVCDAICDPNGNCPPCANPTVHCVPAIPPDSCGGRDLASCELDGRCVVESWACPAICEFDADGGCKPCEAPPAMCVPAPVPDECSTRDLNTCSLDGRCELLAWACPAICVPDGNGGCEPCDAPPVQCVPVTPIDRCNGLDRQTCSAVGCTVVELDCDASCRDDGDGGCLPCDAFLCTSEGSGGGVADAGTPSPRP